MHSVVASKLVRAPSARVGVGATRAEGGGGLHHSRSTWLQWAATRHARCISSAARCSNSGCAWSAASSFSVTSAGLGVSFKLSTPSAEPPATIFPESSFDTAARRTVCVIRRCFIEAVRPLASLVLPSKPTAEGAVPPVSGATAVCVDAPQPIALDRCPTARAPAAIIFTHQTGQSRGPAGGECFRERAGRAGTLNSDRLRVMMAHV